MGDIDHVMFVPVTHRDRRQRPVSGRCGRAMLLLHRHASNEAATGVTAPRGMADSAAAWNIWQLVCCNTRLLWEGQRSVVSAYRRRATDRCRKHAGTTKKKRNPRYNHTKKKERGKMSLTGHTLPRTTIVQSRTTQST